MPSTNELLLNLILYGLLPLWGVTGFIDWCCHRATKIEHTSGLRESLVHSLMGIQLGIPILLGLLFEINVLVLLICLAAFVLHEAVAHYDVRYSAPKRHISIWEVHVHNYMATIPLYLLMLIAVLNWDVVKRLIAFEWAGQMNLTPLPVPVGHPGYLPGYLLAMGVLCVVPYLEENLRCLRAARRRGSPAA
ncbi:MAG: diguanylate cyclase [Burkholderiales bacterium]